MKWKIPLFWNSIGREEVAAVNAVMRSGQLTMGKLVRRFEEAWEKRTGQHAVMVNSGSSANLLMVATMMETKTWGKGQKITVPALCWPTTIWPLIQYGLIPLFVDVRQPAQMAMSLYGEPVNGHCDVADMCEASAPHPNARMSSMSFYFSHHLTTGEGGMVFCRKKSDADIVRQLRAHGWLRETPNWKVKTIYPMDRRFTFVRPGYNVRPTEIAAAIGLEQLKKLDGWNHKRKALAHAITGKDYAYPPFGIMVSSTHRNKSRAYLESLGIETRPILAYMPYQPARFYRRVKSGGLAQAISQNGYSVACHPGMTLAQAKWMGKIIREMT